MIKNKFSQRGLSLIELLISVTIAIVLGGLLIGIVVNNTGVYYNQAAKIQQGLGSNDALSNIRTNIRQAANVAAAYPETGTPTYTSSASELVLKLPAIDSLGNTIENIYDFVIYYTLMQSNIKQLHFRVIPNEVSFRKEANQILSSNVNNIVFDYFDSSSQVVSPTGAAKVKVTLYLNQISNGSTTINVSASEASLRNN